MRRLVPSVEEIFPGQGEPCYTYEKGMGCGRMNRTRSINLIRMVKFFLFSVSAGVIETLAFTLLNETIGWPYWPCYLIALTLSVLYNFTLNRRFTFRSTANVPLAMTKVFLFYCVFTPLSTWLGQVFADGGGNEYLILVVTMAVNLVTEYLYCQFVVYRGTIDTKEVSAGRERQHAKVEE